MKKSKNLIESFNHAVNGIINAVKTERNLKIHFTVAILVMIISLFLIFPGLSCFYYHLQLPLY